MHVAAGGRVALLCLTDGQVGRTGGLCAQEELGRVRAAELAASAAQLGITVVYREQLWDGGLDEISDEEGAAIVKHYADEFGADVLLTFGPEGASGHADHKACWRWTSAAVGDRRFYAAVFPEGSDLPNGGSSLSVTTVIDVTPAEEKKRRAFREHQTQIDHLARHDQIMAALGGKEYYHRVQPPWTDGETPATEF